MFNTHISTQVLQSKLALVLLVVMFVSQIFPTCVAADIHINEQGFEQVSELIPHSPVENQDSCCFQTGQSCSHARSTTEQDQHSDDFHTSCHPPIELSFIYNINQLKPDSVFILTAQNRYYAPPNPPPHA